MDFKIITNAGGFTKKHRPYTILRQQIHIRIVESRNHGIHEVLNDKFGFLNIDGSNEDSIPLHR